MGEEGEAPEWVMATQQGLGTLIKRPKLTAPLLMKPPFRFLHDIVSEVMRTYGFADGLYDENEMNSGKIKDKDSKLAYLAKIISVVELTNGTPIDIRPGKVVAGMEPEKTSGFLQALAQAATSGADHSAAVQQTLAKFSGDKAEAAPPPAPPPPDAYADLPPPGVSPPPPAAAAEMAGPAAGLGLTEPAQPPAEAPPAAAPPMPPAADGALQQMTMAAPPPPKQDEAAAAAAGGGGGGGGEGGSKPERPSTARRAPPKVRSNEVKVERPRPVVAKLVRNMPSAPLGDGASPASLDHLKARACSCTPRSVAGAAGRLAAAAAARLRSPPS
jgi:TRAF3-interacting protein 1